MTNNVLEVYLAIAPKSPEAAVLRLLVELGVQVIRADEGSLLVLDQSGDELVFAMTSGASEGKLIGQRVPLGQGLTGLAAISREVQIGAPTFHGVDQVEKLAKSGGPQAVIAAPMLCGDELAGVLTAVSFTKGRQFNSSDAELMGRIAAVAGLVIHQRHQLDTAASLQRNPSQLAAGRSVAGLEAQIAASVVRIAGAAPDKLEHVAAVLAGVEALCHRS
jgi:GAF domain-containing protein